MATDDFVKKYEYGEVPEDTPAPNVFKKKGFIEAPTDIPIIFDPEEEGIYPLTKVVMDVEHRLLGLWANLEVEYSWNGPGTVFYCNTLQYRVKNIGRTSGNIIFGFASSTFWGGEEISNDNAIQDGKWHPISAGGAVFSNSRTAIIIFEYIFDLANLPDPWASVIWTLEFSLAPPTITNPGVIWTALPTLRGTGANLASVKLYQAGAGTILFGTGAVLGNQWAARLTEPLWMADPFTMTASQTVNGVTSNWAVPTPFAVLFKPVISAVTVSSDGKPTVRGTGGLKDATLEIWHQGGGGGAQLRTTVNSLGNWSVAANAAWPPGTYSITARQIGKVTQQSSDWADGKTFTIKPPKPAITAPPNPAAANQVLTITGVLSGTVTLKMLTEAGAEIPGTFSASGTSRTFTPTTNWAVGTQKVKVVQTVNGVSSDPSNLTTLAVKPSKPAITAPPNPAAANQVLTITGVLSGTVTLKMLTEAGAEIPGTFSASGTSRTFTPTTNWAVGTQKVKVVQTVNGVESDPSDLVTLAVRPPKPVITNPLVVKTDKPTISGTGVAGATVQLYEHNVPAVILGTDTVKTDNTWAVTLTQPLRMADPFTMTAAQTLNGMKSEWTAPTPFAVLFKPVISDVSISPDGRPTVSGTGGLEGATIDIRFQGGADGTQLTATVQPNGSWSVLADDPWPPNTHTITAKQIGRVTQQSSDWSDNKTFTVKPPKPAITALPTPVPTNQVLTITNIYSGTVTLQMLTEAGAEIPGTFSTSGTSRTFTPTTNWAVGTQKVKVVQTVNGVESDPSDLATLAVKPPKPAMTNPMVVRTDKPTISGTGVTGATVKLYEHGVGGVIIGTDTVKTDSTWTATLTQPLPMADPFTMAASQTLNGMTSDWADVINFAVLFKPVISDVTVSPDGRPTASGTGGLEGATVEIRFPGGAGGNKLTATVQPDGTWSAPADAPWVPDTYTITAKQTGPVTGQGSDWSDNKTFTVKPPKPAITAPPNPTPATQVLTITGVYSGTVTLQMLTEAGAEIAGTFATTGHTSLFTPTPDWTPGPHRVKAVQTVNDVASDPSDECLFDVEVGDQPEAPHFELPQPGAKTSTRPLIRVTGRSLALMTVRHEGGQTLHSDTASAEGVFEFVVTTPLVPGANALEVKQKEHGPESDWSEPHRFTVKEPPQTPQIDAPTPGSFNPRKPTIRGQGETRGQILLRHEDDPENLIDTLNGVTSWRWAAQEPWDVGQYTIQVQQTDDGDSSSWSEPRTFEVVDARYGIGDAGPVLAQPVLSNHESVLLRVQAVSGVTGEAVDGVEVEWRVMGEQAILAMSITGPDGWAHYLYTPGTAGEHTVLADLTSENQGIEITQPFEVTAWQDDAWAQVCELYLEGEKVDLAKGELALLGGTSYTLALDVKSASPLMGTSVLLENQSEAEALGLKFVPPLGTPQPLVEGQSVHWSITCDLGKSGYFGLKLTCSILPDWYLPGRIDEPLMA
ncbi:hypothetical protein [Pseudomonas sp. RGM2987]|uniref:hypothetical protein n=1 Tax=Pseudomonas sp. RGM2987 TaxID=2930090 RepID=UPI001FD6A436|nr:hypothetical protein [Pseudomonas sp. RGM2987]MCJ8206619.1 hypothetical protein [Pseudomonas sp. RGM2987]